MKNGCKNRLNPVYNRSLICSTIFQSILPDIISLYDSEEGQREFQARKARREAEAQERTYPKNHT